MIHKEIEKISTWNLPSTISIPDGYDLKRIPEPTKENMVVFMDKINELVQEVNYLRCRLTTDAADTRKSAAE